MQTTDAAPQRRTRRRGSHLVIAKALGHPRCSRGDRLELVIFWGESVMGPSDTLQLEFLVTCWNTDHGFAWMYTKFDRLSKLERKIRENQVKSAKRKED